MSDSTTIYLLLFFGFFLALGLIELLMCFIHLLRLRIQVANFRRLLAAKSKAITVSLPPGAKPRHGSSASPTRPHSGHGRTQPAGILKFQIEQAQILRPKPNGHTPHHHHRNRIDEP